MELRTPSFFYKNLENCKIASLDKYHLCTRLSKALRAEVFLSPHPHYTCTVLFCPYSPLASLSPRALRHCMRQLPYPSSRLVLPFLRSMYQRINGQNGKSELNRAAAEERMHVVLPFQPRERSNQRFTIAVVIKLSSLHYRFLQNVTISGCMIPCCFLPRRLRLRASSCNLEIQLLPDPVCIYL